VSEPVPENESVIDREATPRLQGIGEVHIVGIGGAGMSAIARVLRGWGVAVHGSDRASSPLTEALGAEGIAVTIGHSAECIGAADLVLASSAVADDNVELVAAHAQDIPVKRRPEFLSTLTAGYDVIAVAGAHGKTTVTGMITLALLEAGLDPTYIVGGVMTNLATNARAGTGPHFVIEADEYRCTFLALHPQIAVVTNVAFDHPDCFDNLGHVRLAFGEFVGNIVPGGLLVACADDPVARAIAAAHHAGGERVILYGISGGAELDWRARDLRGNQAGGVSFEVEHLGMHLGEVALRVPGAFNVLNALAVLSVTTELGIAWEVARDALAHFEGTARRFEVLGEVAGVTVIDDYAHHPTQIEGVLRAARDRYGARRLIAVWEPHTFSRIRALYADFMASFYEADEVLVLPIYAAREIDDGTLTSQDLALDLATAGAERHPSRASAAQPSQGADTGGRIGWAQSLDHAVDKLARASHAGDVVLLMGAGREYVVGERLLQRLGGVNVHKAQGAREAALDAIAEALPGVAERNASLATYSGVGIGGPADLLVVAHRREELLAAVHMAQEKGLPWKVYGGLTNILLPDGGLRGVVVVNRIQEAAFGEDYRLTAGAGVVVVKLVRELVARGWGGLTWAIGLPGTIGGAVVNNAGAFGGEISRVLVGADVLGRDGRVASVPVDWFDFRYRCSKLKGAGAEWVVLSADFQLRAGDPETLNAKASEYAERRRRTQPPGRTLGSTFKNPPGDYAGRLIEAAGLKGARCGAIEVSEHHANFLMNTGGGTAADFRALIERVQGTVWEQFSVMLEPEIEIVSEPFAGVHG
jgi:UDP-N-acetylmuramate--alanine ligase